MVRASWDAARAGPFVPAAGGVSPGTRGSPGWRASRGAGLGTGSLSGRAGFPGDVERVDDRLMAGARGAARAGSGSGRSRVTRIVSSRAGGDVETDRFVEAMTASRVAPPAGSPPSTVR